MCKYFEVSRAGYYAWQKKSELPDPDQKRINLIKEAYFDSRRTYGYRRIKISINQKHGINLNHKAVLRLMNKIGIQSVARKRKPLKKWHEISTNHRYPNILRRNFVAKKPNQKWVTDITYVSTKQGWAYLSTIKDLFDGFIVAHHFSRNSSVSLVTQTIKKAIKNQKTTSGVLIHSDQGFQYSSHSYFQLTKEFNLRPSMSRKANPWDNAPIENFFGHLKEECLRQYKNLSFKEAKNIIDEYIYFFNYERIQLKTKQAPYHQRCLHL